MLRAAVGQNKESWLECLPFVEFAYNRAKHSATKLSPFEVVYGFNPITPLDLSPLPPGHYDSQDGTSRSEFIKALHDKVRINIEKRTAHYVKQANKGRTARAFKPGDWVWLHFRPSRFPSQRRHKLAPRGDGPFRISEKINENAYRLELPGEYNVSSTFNITDLSPFDVGEDSVLRAKPSEEGGNDGDTRDGDSREPDQETAEEVLPGSAALAIVPTIQPGIIKRNTARAYRNKFNQFAQQLVDSADWGLDTTESTPELFPEDTRASPGETRQLPQLTESDPRKLFSTGDLFKKQEQVLSVFTISQE